jgi:hypothetical protein
VDWSHDNNAHPELLLAKSLVFDRIGLSCSAPVAETESAEYGAYALAINGRSARFRVAKTTPTKVGLFVTVWQRSEAGPIRPLDCEDDIDLVIITARQTSNFGHFVFPQSELIKRGVMSRKQVGGKRALRVYPPWVSTTSPQARATQRWQVEFFLHLDETAGFDEPRARLLFQAEAEA